MVTVQVRRADVSDADRIAAAYLASWRAGYADLLPPDVLEVEVAKRAAFDWAAEIDRRSSHVAVAVTGGGGGRGDEVLGVVEACAPPGGPRDLPELLMLYVVPEYWGTAVATELLADGVGWLGRQGWAAARLRLVETQRRARRFYEREGWRPDPDIAPAHNGFFSLPYYRRALAP